MKFVYYRKSKCRGMSDGPEDNEIDIAPVMNMFIILVAFLITMVVFTHVAILEFSVPPNVSAGLDTTKGKPKVRLTVRVGLDYTGIVLGDKLLDSLPIDGGNIPFAALAEKLRLRREELSVQDEVVIASRDEVVFSQMVRIMDICRDAGFTKVGLSSATVDPETGK